MFPVCWLFILKISQELLVETFVFKSNSIFVWFVLAELVNHFYTSWDSTMIKLGRQTFLRYTPNTLGEPVHLISE